MMKSLFSLILPLVFSASAMAYDFMVDGLCYNICPDSVNVMVTYELGDSLSGSSSYSITNILKNPFLRLFTKQTYVTIPDSGSYNASLDDIIIPEQVTFDGKSYAVTHIGNSTFRNCATLTSVTIPKSVTEIGDDAFTDCTGLTSITIPNSVKQIGLNAFKGCTNLVSIDVEPTNTTFDSRANCNAIIETTANLLIVGCNDTKIPATVKEIGSEAFLGCTGLTSVTIPSSVTEIRSSAFKGCTGLTSVTIPNSVTEIGSSAFEGCTNLTSVTIPNSVTEIRSSAFKGCTGLTSVTIPNSVTEIGSSAFEGCTNLTSVTIPNSVTEIGSAVFYGCTGLTSVKIPNSVAGIGSKAFYGCTGLTSVTIPNSVAKINEGAFENCINIESIVCWIEDPQKSTDIKAFNGVNRQTCKLLIPRGCIKSYNSAAPWLYFKNIIETLSINIDDTEEVEQNPLLLRQKFQQHYNECKYSNAIEIGELILAQEVYATDSTHALLIKQLADCYYKVHSYIKAKEYYEIIDTTFASINENDNYKTAFRNERLGDCCMETNDYANAEIYYKKAYKNYMSCDSLNVQYEVVNTLYGLHSCYIAQGKLLEAIDPYLELKPRKTPSSKPFEKWRDYFNLYRILIRGDYLCSQNLFNEALEMYDDGIGLYQKIKGEQSLEIAVMYERTGRCYLLMQQYDQALGNLNLSRSSLRNHPNMWLEWTIYRIYSKFFKRFKYWNGLFLDLLLDYCIYYASQGDVDSSYTHLKIVLKDIYKESINFLSNHTEEERSEYWEKNSPLFCEIYPYVVTMAAYKRFNRHNNAKFNYSDLYGDLYNKSALFAKGLLLTSDNEFSRIIFESGDSILISRYKELEALRNLPGPPTDEQNKMIADEARALENELIVVSKEYREFTDNLQLKWEDVQTRLGDDDIAIEFLSFPKLGSDSTFYIALTVRKDYDSPHMVFLGEENELNAAAKKAYTSNELSHLIWGRLSNELKRDEEKDTVKNIYFSPSGMLHQVAIESMPHWEDTELIMNQCYNIYRLSSTRELVIERNSIQLDSAAVYGDIEYNTPVVAMGTPRKVTDESSSNGKHGFDADFAGYRGKEWDNLRYSKPEINSITSILESKKIDVYKMAQKDATETSFKALSKQKKNIIHISTHGFCWNDSAAREKGKNRTKPLSFLGNGLDAMTRSGLIFSGANHCFADGNKSTDVIPEGFDDGVLTAYEASQLDLRGLDLLVLSACETGLGEISAEGVFGLQRGFKRAGARSIIMSLWTVNDLATSDMMTQFYKYWIEFGMSKQKAFFKAQQDLKDKDNDYIYDEDKETDKKMRATRPHWAAFILLDATDN